MPVGDRFRRTAGQVDWEARERRRQRRQLLIGGLAVLILTGAILWLVTR